MQSQALRDKVVRFLLSENVIIIAHTVLLLILTIFLLQAFGKAYREHGYDFTSYLLSSRALLNGANPYETGSPFPFIYPLFLCVILYPFTALPYWLSNLLWFLSNVAALYFSASVLLKLHWASLSYKEITILFLVPFLMLTNVVQNNLLNGQVNLMVLLLCVLFLNYYIGSHKFTASVLLAAAIAIKLTPLIFIPYLILRKDFVWAALAMAISFVFIFGLPYAISGPVTLEWYSQYVSSFLTDQLSNTGQSSDGFAYSITSIISLLLPNAPKILSFILAAVVSLVPIFWVQFASRKEDSTDKQSLMFALYMSAILLISPMSETHHLIYLFPAILLLALAMFQFSQRHRHIGILVLIVVLTSSVFGKFYFPANIAAIISLYITLIWIISQPHERATAYNNQKHDAHII